jgi:hypothetical protein
MNDQGLMLIYKNRPYNSLAWDLFECLSEEERNRIWDLIYEQSNQAEMQDIDNQLNCIKEKKND